MSQTEFTKEDKFAEERLKHNVEIKGEQAR